VSRKGHQQEPSRFPWRIQPVLIVAMALLVVFSISLLTAIEAWREQARYRQELEERGLLLADVLEQVLAEALYFNDVERARQLAEVVEAMPEVDHYQVFNRQGRILVDSRAAKYSSGAIDPELLNTIVAAGTTMIRESGGFQIIAPIAVGDEILGGVVVSLDTADVAPHIRLIVRERLRYGGIAVGIGIMVAWLLGRRLTSPIRELIKAARRVAEGNLRFSVARTRGDEIGDLTNAFEEMVRELEQRAMIKAEEHNVQLEKANERLRQQATEDALTGLPNRRLLLDRFTVAKAKANRRHEKVALLFLDLDEFKIINDSLGHSAGDAVLLELARRLRTVVREEDTLARFGGDEFIVLVAGLKERDEVEVIAPKILESIAKPVSVGDREFRLTASLGISIYPDDGSSAGDLLRKADIAMYRAKEFGGSKYQSFYPEMENLVRRRPQRQQEPAGD
jgi:diguanylate cyclase (GGDEF)-like protein